MANKCNNPKVICPKCIGEHISNDCKSTNTECANCKYAVEVLKVPNITYHHAAYDKECESYKRIYNQLLSRIQYPQIFNSKSNNT